MTLDTYLARIGLDQRPPATLTGLTQIHRAHLESISYENIDVQLGRPVGLEIPAIYDKLVANRRGGWCYEMNGLLGWALGELGFAVTRATGAVWRAAMGDASNGNHLVLRVELPEGLYLADVGFGDGPRDPIPIAVGAFVSHGFHYGVSRVDNGWWRLSDARAGAKSFDFHLDPADESLLAQKCAFLQTAPQSPFVQNLVAQRHTAQGHSIIRGRTMTLVTPSTSVERTFADAGDLVATLQGAFALDVPDVASLWPRICARHEAVLAQRAAGEAASTSSGAPAAAAP
jgi:N-hydroxyarylamine O-acetyltransferase